MAKRIFTTNQKKWLARYMNETGFEPMHMDDFKSKEMSWDDLVRNNINWLELHYQERFEAASAHLYSKGIKYGY